MLKQRIITALIIAPIFLGGIFLLGPLYFALFIAAIIGVAAWEWANMAGVTSPVGRWGYAAVMLAAIFVTSFIPSKFLFILSVFWWVLALLLVVNYPEKTEHWESTLIRLLIGFFVLLPAWHALVFIRNGSVSIGTEFDSLWVILYVMFVVWGADVGAYFAGRAFGKKKLAPSVSPGKSWAGVYGGLVVIEMMAIGVGIGLNFSAGKTVALMLVTFITGIVSVLGDLLESMLKRHRGIKDSSQLLPGHGGVMDRVDSLTAALPIFAFAMLVLGWMR